MPKRGFASVTLRRDVAELLRVRARLSGLGLNEYLLRVLNWNGSPEPATRVQIPAAALASLKTSFITSFNK
ncbi:MAG: hypothetical protein QXR17_00075 [Candidatus Bathyarchaeia archaeon]